MPKLIDITNLRVGTWLVLGPAGYRAGQRTWLCRCDCGTERVLTGQTLRRGDSRNCGCLRHGFAKRGPPNPTYRCWQNMIQRTTNPRSQPWNDYGGRGITVCERWRFSFQNFLADMGERPPGLTIERRDNAQGYSPENCYWADRFTQNRNRRRKGTQKLEADQVRAIRADPRSYGSISADYGIAPQHVGKIKNRQQWAHLPD